MSKEHMLCVCFCSSVLGACRSGPSTLWTVTAHTFVKPLSHQCTSASEVCASSRCGRECLLHFTSVESVPRKQGACALAGGQGCVACLCEVCAVCLEWRGEEGM